MSASEEEGDAGRDWLGGVVVVAMIDGFGGSSRDLQRSICAV